MFQFRTKNRKAISAVLTTIIILVASIVLGTGVVVYSTSLFQSGGQSQGVQVQGLSYWVNGTWTSGSTCPGAPCGPIGTSIAWAAFAVKNTGDKLLAVNSITIRSSAVPFTNWYADTDQIRVAQNFQAQLNYSKNDINGNIKGSFASGFTGMNPLAGVANGACPTNAVQPFGNPYATIVIQESRASGLSPLCLVQQSGPVSLTPGSSAIIYVKLPNNLAGPTDAGVTSTIGILAGNSPVAQTVRIAAAQ